MAINNNGQEFSDVLEDVILQGVVTIGTTEVELKVGATVNPDREVLRVYNNSNRTIYVGPSGVTSSTGEPVFKDQSFEAPIGAQSLFAVTDNSTADVIVWELG